MFVEFFSKLLIEFYYFSMLQPGRVARAVSLCLFNKIQTGQTYYSEAPSVARYSIPSHDDHYRASTSQNILRQAYGHSIDSHTNKDSKLPEVCEDNESSLPHNAEKLYDGLKLLDKTNLDEMVETDLVTSSNC